VLTKWPLPYARGIAVKPDDPRVLFAGCGETTTGETGAVLRSGDGGQTWRSLPLPVRPNATMWGLATHPADPGRIVAWSLFGEVYVTDDAGESWRKIPREFGEIAPRPGCRVEIRGATLPSVIDRIDCQVTWDRLSGLSLSPPRLAWG
jgi:hypothetical protein